MIKGYETTINSVFGLPPNPFKWKPKENRFPMIMIRSQNMITNAFCEWLYEKENGYVNEEIKNARMDVKGLVRMYLDCIAELYHRENVIRLEAYGRKGVT